MVFVFKIGSAEHVNNFGLGANGRYRTNVWDYAGISSISASRLADLAMHPTVKPTALVADAIKDCSRRGGTILDPFGGSGTTLIAAEGTGRRALLMELDPLYCDTVIRRFEKLTGKSATLVNSGATFEHTAEKRLKDGPAPPSC
jgi:DNA modification methylase